MAHSIIDIGTGVPLGKPTIHPPQITDKLQ